MKRETFPVGPLQCNCTIVSDTVSQEAIVVDPGSDLPRIVSALERDHLTVRQIVITHAHIDHIAGALELKRLTGAPILYNQLDLPLVAIMDEQAEWLGVPTPEVAPPDLDLLDGQTLRTQNLAAQVIATPGHTQGSLCLFLPEHHLLLAGDTLFAGSIGRTDLPGGDYPTLLHSIHTRLLPLPGETIVIPGHGPATTLDDEREFNPFLRTR